jgi:hypothetical protein
MHNLGFYNYAFITNKFSVPEIEITFILMNMKLLYNSCVKFIYIVCNFNLFKCIFYKLFQLKVTKCYYF